MTHSFPTRRSSDLVVVVQYRTYHTIFVHALFLKTGVTSGNVVPSRNGTNTITKGIVRSLSRKADDVGINVRRKTKSSGLQGFRFTRITDVTNLNEVGPTKAGTDDLGQHGLLRTDSAVLYNDSQVVCCISGERGMKIGRASCRERGCK